MLFRFNIGRSRGGGIGFRNIPIYYMPYWRVSRAEDYRVDYRPSERTLAHLLGISLMAVFVLEVIVWQAGFPWSSADQEKKAGHGLDDPAMQQKWAEIERLVEEMKRDLPPEKVAESEQAERQRELEKKVRRSSFWLAVIHGAGRVLHWIAFCAFCAAAILPLVGYPLQKVTIERTSDDELIVRKRGLWPSTRRWPLDTFGQIVYEAEEEGSEEEYASIRYQRATIGWMWMVKLRVAPEVPLEHGPSLVDDPEIAFYIDRQNHRPVDMSQPPQSVKRLVKHLRRLTDVKVIGHTEVEPEDSGLVTRRRIITTTTSEPVVSREVSRSADEVPEHLRGRVKQLMERAGDGEPVVHRSVRITVRDSNGNEHTYTSLDEMPPDLRAQYEDAMRPAIESD